METILLITIIVLLLINMVLVLRKKTGNGPSLEIKLADLQTSISKIE
jgi:hypothetical protein